MVLGEDVINSINAYAPQVRLYENAKGICLGTNRWIDVMNRQKWENIHRWGLK